MPPDLWARRIWVPLSGSKPSLVEVTDRKRLFIGAVIMLLGFVVVVAVRAEHLHWAYAVSALILEVGRNKPDLRSMRGTKVRS